MDCKPTIQYENRDPIYSLVAIEESQMESAISAGTSRFTFLFYYLDATGDRTK